jgi:hypothetical protein
MVYLHIRLGTSGTIVPQPTSIGRSYGMYTLLHSATLVHLCSLHVDPNLSNVVPSCQVPYLHVRLAIHKR